MTARRQAVIQDYDEEINKLYDLVQESTQSYIPLPEMWNATTTTEFVRSVVQKVLIHTVADEDDIFQHGCDRFVNLMDCALHVTHREPQPPGDLDPQLSSSSSS